jgi:hypothetical protein
MWKSITDAEVWHGLCWLHSTAVNQVSVVSSSRVMGPGACRECSTAPVSRCEDPTAGSASMRETRDEGDV